ncbi:maleylpyruvate isomerase family mycothiol-dependent enzyme [Nocardioides aestuarii]|uniref:Maleylpyruvate isomerase family mycothiol-dependent enzyme n=1 Tax=Nocardioides aestuarii TaxID=252231 RepID=A0ABW4TLT2_9ACTN
MDTDTVWKYIDLERAFMADLLESLTDEQWRMPSLCDAWTVRDVGAHIAFAQSSVTEILGPALRAGFRYNVFVRDSAIRSPLTHDEIVAKIRSFLGSRRRVAFITDLEPLIDILVHNQDIARPLGVDHPMPPEAAAAAADRVLTTPVGLKRWRNPRGVRLVATDTDWSWGDGTEVPDSMEGHLMRLTGRAA